MFGIPGMDLGRIILYVVIGIIYVYKFVKHKKLDNLIIVFVCIYGLTSASFILKPYRGIVRKMRIYNVKSIFPADTKGLQVFVSICNSLYFFF